MSSGEYGDVVPGLVKAWKAHCDATKKTEKGMQNGSSQPNAYFKQMMVSILPRCTIKEQNNTMLGDVGQLSQVSLRLAIAYGESASF